MFQIKAKSKHAFEERLQQRGVPEYLLELANLFGEKNYGHKKACHFYFSERSIKRMTNAGVPKKFVQLAEGKRNLRLVVSTDEGCLITAIYAFGRGRLRVNQ